MHTPQLDMGSLFSQLGLSNQPTDIDRFIETHRGLPANMDLADAPFWNMAQASFIRESLNEDADWAEVIDQLSAMLHN